MKNRFGLTQQEIDFWTGPKIGYSGCAETPPFNRLGHDGDQYLQVILWVPDASKYLAVGGWMVSWIRYDGKWRVSWSLPRSKKFTDGQSNNGKSI